MSSSNQAPHLLIFLHVFFLTLNGLKHLNGTMF